jgi:large-conductance mechanosensitive channel
MRPSKEVKKNRGFKTAFRVGAFIIVILSLIISWIAVSIIKEIDERKNSQKKGQTEETVDMSPDTIYVEKIREKIVKDTVYKYISPIIPKSKSSEDGTSPKRDTLSK